ncbi:hypothetical protein DPMN_131079 [Dreissena polymorpha]|uniref:Uncharacterized protein n=1 Tax=Dreissena polymorpha TaxID=45954 RepID=A0A9D4H8V5_DREPO|nr:hypothetical protein DPMN_131079 [Dreissena polymorpha]
MEENALLNQFSTSGSSKAPIELENPTESKNQGCQRKAKQRLAFSDTTFKLI